MEFLRSTGRALPAAWFGVVGGVSAWLVVGGPAPEKGWVANLGQVVAGAAAAVAAIRTARRRRRNRRSWMLVGVAVASWTLGQVAWTYLELLAGNASPISSLANVGFLATFPVAIVAIVSFARTDVNARGRLGAILDAAIIAGSALFVSWSLVLGEVVASMRNGGAASLMTLVYPVGDIVLLSAALFLATRSHPGERRSLLTFALAVGVLVTADSAFAHAAIKPSAFVETLADVGWMIGFSVVFAAARVARHGDDDEPDHRTSRLVQTILTYAMAGIALLVSAVVSVRDGQVRSSQVLIALGVIAAMIARQLVAVIENARLMRALDQKVEALRIVAETERDLARHLQAVNAMKDAFLTKVSHELRTPMTAIFGYARMLQVRGARMTEAERDECVDRLVTSSDRFRVMVEDLVDVARPSDLPRVPALAPADVAAILREVTAGATQSHAVHLDVARLVVSVDADIVRRIVTQLVSNAVRHTPSGTDIWIRAEMVGDDLLLVVEDAGPGIAVGERARIFEPFEQRAGAEYVPGVGIGLPLVARLARSHGGAVMVRERRGGGANFTVLIKPDEGRADAAQYIDAMASP